MRRLHRTLDVRLPRLVATPLTVVLVLVIASILLRNVVADGLTSAASASFSVVDRSTNEGTEQPSDPMVSGSPDSLVPWDSLGVHGRDFVAQATSDAELAAFQGDDGTDSETLAPIRAYVGLRSTDTADERADLAVRELERTGAFDREVLVVITVTGSGWVDPDAAVAIEQMYAGDTALVALQYSYLPSWMTTLIDPDSPAEGASALFEAVHERWEDEPADDRPQLVVFGLSLGSYGAEGVFAGPDAASSIANLTARTDGALFVGPTNGNPIWRQVTADRGSGSPVWQPVYDDGATVRFANRDPQVGPLDPAWEQPRVLYIQHPSDPVTFWSFDTLWSPPEWQDRPRGVGVPDQGGWFPIVTWTQGLFDLMAGFGAPPGFGHDYRLDYVAGWAQVAPPPGWDAADTQALESFLHDT